ncbi:MAG: hypothetical protein U5L11_01315 [Arhodomonas sp.]|nr:hypothetical protein [Arhodomonas sp.]
MMSAPVATGPGPWRAGPLWRSRTHTSPGSTTRPCAPWSCTRWRTPYPGPDTYKRFWFRDAAFIVHALLDAGLTDRARRMLAPFPGRQHRTTGYFHSQDGEWDANGQALWILSRYHEVTGEELPEAWLQALRRGARWIARKRTDAHGDAPHAGLLPAGFSAEHFGPNDYYYWDDYWSVAGLQAAAAGPARSW